MVGVFAPDLRSGQLHRPVTDAPNGQVAADRHGFVDVGYLGHYAATSWKSDRDRCQSDPSERLPHGLMLTESRPRAANPGRPFNTRKQRTNRPLPSVRLKTTFGHRAPDVTGRDSCRVTNSRLTA